MKGEDDDGKENRRIPFLDEREREREALQQSSLYLWLFYIHQQPDQASTHIHTHGGVEATTGSQKSTILY